MLSYLRAHAHTHAHVWTHAARMHAGRGWGGRWWDLENRTVQGKNQSLQQHKVPMSQQNNMPMSQLNADRFVHQPLSTFRFSRVPITQVCTKIVQHLGFPDPEGTQKIACHVLPLHLALSFHEDTKIYVKSPSHRHEQRRSAAKRPRCSRVPGWNRMHVFLPLIPHLFSLWFDAASQAHKKHYSPYDREDPWQEGQNVAKGKDGEAKNWFLSLRIDKQLLRSMLSRK